MKKTLIIIALFSAVSAGSSIAAAPTVNNPVTPLCVRRFIDCYESMGKNSQAGLYGCQAGLDWCNSSKSSAKSVDEYCTSTCSGMRLGQDCETACHLGR